MEDIINNGNCVNRKGEDHFRAKLTNDEVSLIRVLHKDGFSKDVLAESFKVSLATIDKIIARDSWKHLR